MLNSNEVLNGNFAASRRYVASGASAHDGIDFKAPNGTIVKSRYSGVVRVTGTNPPGQDFGTYVRVFHPQLNQSTWYAHLQSHQCKVGQQVSAGQTIGISNNTGLSTGPHLHFSQSKGETTQWLDPDTQQSGGDEPMISDADNEFGRWEKGAYKIRGRHLSREEFRKSAVGQTWLRSNEILEDDPEADRTQAAMEVGLVAVRDNWEGQIASLTTQVTDLTTENQSLKEQVAVLNQEVAKLKQQLSDGAIIISPPSDPLANVSGTELVIRGIRKLLRID